MVLPVAIGRFVAAAADLLAHGAASDEYVLAVLVLHLVGASSAENVRAMHAGTKKLPFANVSTSMARHSMFGTY